MKTVALGACQSYESPELDEVVRGLVDHLGGIGRFVRPGDRVLIKPNMLSAHAPDRRITTDPALVRVVGRMALEAGGRVAIGDSPALDSFKKTAEKTGIKSVAEEIGVDLVELDNPRRVSPPEPAVFKSLELASPALDADVVINLPKLKTHAQMLLTLGVKNTFGTVVKRRKAEWHLAGGVDRESFASLLLDIHAAIRPALTILDGIWGMEGRGPANGRPRFIGLLAASEDALSLDLALCRILKVPLNRFPLYQAALARGILRKGEERYTTVGADPEALAVDGFDLPKLSGSGFLPGFLNAWSRRHLVSKPVQEESACEGCSKCVEICPADAARLDGRKVTFDYGRCIRCYCCQEVCPADAIGFRTGLALRIVNRLGW